MCVKRARAHACVCVCEAQSFPDQFNGFVGSSVLGRSLTPASTSPCYAKPAGCENLLICVRTACRLPLLTRAWRGVSPRSLASSLNFPTCQCQSRRTSDTIKRRLVLTVGTYFSRYDLRVISFGRVHGAESHRIFILFVVFYLFFIYLFIYFRCLGESARRPGSVPS